jgi:hypothetical protein
MVFDTFLIPAMAHEAQQPTTYTLNLVVGTDGKERLVLTNSSLPVIPSFPYKCFNGNALPCHDSHTPELCFAKIMMDTSEIARVVHLRLTSYEFDGEIIIEVYLNKRFLELFTEETTVVFFPLPLKPVVYNMTERGGVITLTIPSLPVVEKRVITGEIPMEEIRYTLPDGIPYEKWSKRLWLPKTSETPKFFEEETNSEYRCSLPDECLTSIQCHDSHVPVKCSAKQAWIQNESKTSVVLLLSSELLKTPIYVRIDTHSSFLDLFSGGKTNEVFFPLPIPKRMVSVEVKDISNVMFKCLKGQSGHMKKSEREEKNERGKRGETGYDNDDPLPNTYEVQRPNQVWSIFSKRWELIRKPKPRDRDWKWDDSTTSWICKIDPITKFLIEFDRTGYSNCWPKLPTTQQATSIPVGEVLKSTNMQELD